MPLIYSKYQPREAERISVGSAGRSNSLPINRASSELTSRSLFETFWAILERDHLQLHLVGVPLGIYQSNLCFGAEDREDFPPEARGMQSASRRARISFSAPPIPPIPSTSSHHFLLLFPPPHLLSEISLSLPPRPRTSPIVTSCLLARFPKETKEKKSQELRRRMMQRTEIFFFDPLIKTRSKDSYVLRWGESSAPLAREDVERSGKRERDASTRP